MYRFLITFGVNALGINLLKSVQTNSVALCTGGASVTTIALFYNPPFPPFLRVTLLQTLNTSGRPYHSKILKSLIKDMVTG